MICRVRLGRYPRPEGHSEAVSLPAEADDECAKHLQALLGMKSKAEYTHSKISATEAKRAGRAAAALLKLTRTLGAA